MGAKYKPGLTIVETMTIIVVLAILASGAMWVDGALAATTKSGRNSERAQDVSSIARSFELYYRNNPTAAGPTYPTTTQVASSIDTLINDVEIITPPQSSGPNLIVASSTDDQSPGRSEYIYQPFTSAPTPTLCSAAPCVRFNLYYLDEKTNSVVRVESSHQQ